MIIEFKRTLEIPDDKAEDRGFVDMELQRFTRDIIKDAMHGDIKKDFHEVVKSNNSKRKAEKVTKAALEKQKADEVTA